MLTMAEHKHQNFSAFDARIGAVLEPLEFHQRIFLLTPSQGLRIPAVTSYSRLMARGLQINRYVKPYDLSCSEETNAPCRGLSVSIF